MADWKKEWLDRNGFKWIGENSYVYEFENFELEVKEDENGMYMACVIPDASWSFSDFKLFESPKDAVLHAVKSHKELERLIHSENEALDMVKFV